MRYRALRPVLTSFLFTQSDSLWGCLAGMATVARELETAEIAYSCIDQADKVEYLRYIKVGDAVCSYHKTRRLPKPKLGGWTCCMLIWPLRWLYDMTIPCMFWLQDLSSAEAQAAELTLLAGSPLDAEAILIHTNQVFRAIMLNIQLYQWDKWVAHIAVLSVIGIMLFIIASPTLILWLACSIQQQSCHLLLYPHLIFNSVRALAMAVKYKTHIDTVIAFRKKYLERFEKEETNQLFLQYKSVGDVALHRQNRKAIAAGHSYVSSVPNRAVFIFLLTVWE